MLHGFIVRVKEIVHQDARQCQLREELHCGKIRGGGGKNNQ